jgi:GH24 family phage-related lysozyme (muramidase)
MTNTKKTRFKITTFVNVFFAMLSMYSVFEGLETVAMTCVAGMLTITTGYIAGDTHRKS